LIAIALLVLGPLNVRAVTDHFRIHYHLPFRNGFRLPRRLLSAPMHETFFIYCIVDDCEQKESRAVIEGAGAGFPPRARSYQVSLPMGTWRRTAGRTDASNAHTARCITTTRCAARAPKLRR